MNRAASALEPLRLRLRRAQLIVGLGFGSLVLGVFLFAGLASRLASLFGEGLPAWIAVPLGAVLVRLWVLLLLPLLAYGLARLVALRPWTTAFGAAATGEAFLLALEAITAGPYALLAQPWLLAVRAATLAAGIALTALAVRKGRLAARAAEERARAAAASRQSEYEAFLKDSERVASSREAAASKAPPDSATTP